MVLTKTLVHHRNHRLLFERDDLGKYKQAEPLLVEALEGMRRTLNEEDAALLDCMAWRGNLYRICRFTQMFGFSRKTIF